MSTTIPLARWARRLIRIAAVVMLLVALSLLVGFARSDIVVGPTGVHRYWVVLLAPVGGIQVNIFSGTGDAVAVRGFLDGPVVQRTGTDGWSARWFCEDRVGASEGRGDTLAIDCAGKTHRFPLAPVATASPIAPMPERLIALSDLEGNGRFLDAALRQTGVVDADGRWAFGRGHLVVLGDSVDRGREVFKVLWTLYRLAGEASAAGGAVHVVIGNHEQYVLKGSFSRAHEDHRYALRRMGGPRGSFAADTVIGEWLRRQPVMLKLGDTLFVHGGVSPQVAAQGLDIATLNDTARRYWNRRSTDAATDAVFGWSGLTQYRGYLSARPDYPIATQRDVDAMLARYGARRIVVGHTKVPAVTAHFAGRVWAINVNDDDARPEVLLIERGVPRALDIGVRRGIDPLGAGTVRDLRWSDPADRHLVAEVFRYSWAMERIPHPY
ncbi:MAG: metallophosphoesterase [Gammaproteobacteria bacterium]